MLDLTLKPLELHGLVADLGLGVVDEAVAVVELAGLEPCLHGGTRASALRWASLSAVTPNPLLRASSVSPRKSLRTTSALRRLDQRQFSPRSPSAAALALHACGVAEGALCRGVLIAPCIVAPFPKSVSQETVQRTRFLFTNSVRYASCNRFACVSHESSVRSPSGALSPSRSITRTAASILSAS